MQTAFSRFVRSGGHGSIVLDLKAGRGPAHKDGPPVADARSAFIGRLVGAQRANGDMIRQAVGEALDLSPRDLVDAPEALQAAVDAWNASVPALHDDLALQTAIEDRLVRDFARALSERRQGALGISRYTWRSRDDARVRADHAHLDDTDQSWDDPPDGHHPGDAFGCRCWAEPLLEETDEPLTGIALFNLQFAAESGGIVDALKQVVADGLESVVAIGRLARDVGALVYLEALNDLGLASEGDRRALVAARADYDARVDGVVAALVNLPDTLAAFLAYVAAVETRAAGITDLYFQGLATEGDVREAFAERSQMRTLIALSLVPASVPRRLLGLPDRSDAPEDPYGLAAMLGEEVVRLRRDPNDVDWRVVPNPGIDWGALITVRGAQWEDALERRGDLGLRLTGDFPRIDFYDEASGLATSAKTLNTSEPGYNRRPRQIFSTLTR